MDDDEHMPTAEEIAGAMVEKARELDLDDGRRAFCEFISQGYPKGQSYQNSHPGVPWKSCAPGASRLLREPRVTKFLEFLREQSGAGTVMTIRRKRQIAEAMAETTVTDFRSDEGGIEIPDGPAAYAVKKITVFEMRNKEGDVAGTRTTLELVDRAAAIKLDNELAGIDPEELAATSDKITPITGWEDERERLIEESPALKRRMKR